MNKLRWPVALFAAVTVLTSACAEAESGPPPDVLDPQKRSHSSGAIVVEEVAEGLNVGWDIGFLPDGKLLIPERPGTLSVVSSTKPGAKVSKVKADLPKPYVEAEGGLLGMVLHPDFEKSRKFTLCQTTEADGEPKDIRLTTWRLSKDNKRAEHVKDLITGLPIHKTGQHVGCRPTIGPDGELLIGTGDAWQPTTSQDKTNLGGKVLRVDLETGKGLPDNPFADSKDENTRRILTFGHRNVQGVAVRPGNNEVWTVEHGPGRDDEINLVKPGGNYGWDPSLKGELTDPESYTGQDPKTEMTNRELYPDAVEAKWATGTPTEAMCAAVFLEGEHWGDLEGSLAVTSLKGSKLLLMSVDGNSRVVEVDVPRELDETYHRLRAARIGPDGALYLTTAGGENDYLLRVTPGK